MLRSFLGRKRVLACLAVGTTLAFSVSVIPALGGPSLKQLVKKEVAKQLKGKTGPQGPPGPPGANGAANPSAASFVGNSPGSTVIGTSDTDVLSTQITLASQSVIEANAMLTIGVTTNPRVVVCYIKVNGTDISTRSQDTISNGLLDTVPVVGAVTKPAGTYTVTSGCQSSGAAATVTYNNGNLNVIAAGG
jgi:hypothetical protein